MRFLINEKLGPWHCAKVKPVHVGAYQGKMFFAEEGGEYYPVIIHWDGVRWGEGRCAKSRKYMQEQDWEWRGLVEKP